MKRTKTSMTVGELCERKSNGQIRQRPPVTELSSDQIHRIKQVWNDCARFWGTFNSFETFELGFCRDEHPDSEIACWEGIAGEYQRRHAGSENKGDLITRLVVESFRK